MAFSCLGSDECRALIKVEVSPDFDMLRDIPLVNNLTKKFVEFYSSRGVARNFKYESSSSVSVISTQRRIHPRRNLCVC